MGSFGFVRLVILFYLHGQCKARVNAGNQTFRAIKMRFRGICPKIIKNKPIYFSENCKNNLKQYQTHRTERE